jgi:hypothetical protein
VRAECDSHVSYESYWSYRSYSYAAARHVFPRSAHA